MNRTKAKGFRLGPQEAMEDLAEEGCKALEEAIFIFARQIGVHPYTLMAVVGAHMLARGTHVSVTPCGNEDCQACPNEPGDWKGLSHTVLDRAILRVDLSIGPCRGSA